MASDATPRRPAPRPRLANLLDGDRPPLSRRNYLLLLLFLTAVWVIKLIIHPARPQSFADLYSRLAVGGIIPPWFVAVSSVGFVFTAVVLALTCPSQEQVEDWSTHYRRVAARARD